MKTLKKINLRGISEILSEKELKNVMGGSGGCTPDCTGKPNGTPCKHSDCTSGGCHTSGGSSWCSTHY